jgi:hypothetical protein
MLTIDSSFTPFGLFLPILVAIMLIAAWVILAGSRFIQGGVVERPERVPQLYGYTVCLIALIWALASVVAIIENGLSISAPEYRERSQFGWEPSVTSFEAFRTSYDRVRMMSVGDPRYAKLDSIPEAELRKRYATFRADFIRMGRYESQRNLIVASLSLVLAAALFAFHWRWLRRMTPHVDRGTSGSPQP